MANTKTRSEQGNSESKKSIQTKFLVLYLERKTIDILPSNIREDKNQSSIIISVDKNSMRRKVWVTTGDHLHIITRSNILPRYRQMKRRGGRGTERQGLK
jgi:cyanophycinase-like exopeptidase